MASISGITVDPDCVNQYHAMGGAMKPGAKRLAWIVFKISDDWKQIEVEKTSLEDNYEEFRNHLLNAKSKDKRGNEVKGARYAVYYLEFKTEEGQLRTKTPFISWVPDDAGLHPRMMYSSSKGAIMRALGFEKELQANDADDIEYNSVLAHTKKNVN